MAGIGEPTYDDDGYMTVDSQQTAVREGGMPSGANLVNTAGRREQLSKSRELLGAIATALHLSEFDFGQTQSSNRSNSETLERGKREHLRFNQGLIQNAYNKIMRHIAPDEDDWAIQMSPLEDIDTPQRVGVLRDMEESGFITLASAARLALPLVGLDPDMVEAEVTQLLADQEVDFGDDDGLFGIDDNEPPPVAARRRRGPAGVDGCQSVPDWVYCRRRRGVRISEAIAQIHREIPCATRKKPAGDWSGGPHRSPVEEVNDGKCHYRTICTRIINFAWTFSSSDV